MVARASARLSGGAGRRGGRSLRWLAACVGLGVLVPLHGAGVLIDSGDGKGNVAAPADDPGWARMATRAPCPPRCGLSYFYLGSGWVITARHVGAGPARFESSGSTYAAIEGSAHEVSGVDGKVDLLLFRLQDGPDLPLYPIVERPPPSGSEVLMIGRGRSRGKPLSGAWPGWQARSPARMRWGTNRVDGRGRVDGMRLFWLRFDRRGSVFATEHEAHATAGDSGGPVLVKSGDQWELAGIMVNATDPVYDEGMTGAIDLAYYRDEIQEIVAD